jgi:hypothetical protein
VQPVLFQISIELPIIVAADMHARKHNAEHALVKPMVALIGSGRRDARALADTLYHLLIN